MCVTVNKYQSVISKLESEVYPNINYLINKMIDEDGHFFSNATNIKQLKTEFTSLEMFERKMIFPSIISTFNASATHFAPNISDIITLTKSKEEKIVQLLLLLEDSTKLISIENKKTDFKASNELFNSFKASYFPIKMQWKMLLIKLSPENVKCNNRDGNSCKCKADMVIEKLAEKEINIS